MQQRIWLSKLRSRTFGCGMSLAIAMSWISAARSQPNADLSAPEICEVDLSLLKSNDRGTDNNIVTADTFSAKGLTIPSLWWTSEEFTAKLVTNWIADRRQSQIYLLVNTQAWNGLDYLDRYHTIDRFGRVAQGYGYSLKICNSQKITIASYICPQIDRPLDSSLISKEAQSTPQNSCQIWFDAIGQNGLSVQTK